MSTNSVTTAREVLHSPWIGDIEFDSACELEFAVGLPGFETCHRFLPVEIPARRPLVYLHAIEAPDVCFVALPVLAVDPHFRLSLSEEDELALGFDPGFQAEIGADVLCLVFLIPWENTVEVNLGSPVVINLRNRRGIQCVPSTPVSKILRLSAGIGWMPVC
jgi:flagellar assembly factor FliW